MNNVYYHGEGKKIMKLSRDLYKAKPKHFNLAGNRNTN